MKRRRQRRQRREYLRAYHRAWVLVSNTTYGRPETLVFETQAFGDRADW